MQLLKTYHRGKVESDIVGEAHARSNEGSPILVELLEDGALGGDRVEVERNIKVCASLEEDVPLGCIVEDWVVICCSLIVIDERTEETIFFNASCELIGSCLRVVHRKSSETSESLGV
jgi:hypothetical protein